MSSPSDSPLSSIGSEDGRTTPKTGTDTRPGLLDTPTHNRRRASSLSHDDGSHASKRRKLDEAEDSDDLGSQISSDSFGSAPGSPSADEHALRSEAVTACQWEGCGAGDLGNSDGLIAHVQQEHVGAKRPKFTCDWGDCARKGMNHPSGYALKAHMRSHTKEKPFFCALPECDRSFTRSDALAKHMRTVHEPEPPKASLTNANPIDPATGQPKKGPKLRLMNGKGGAGAAGAGGAGGGGGGGAGTGTQAPPALTADKNPLNAGLTPDHPDYDPSPPNDNIRYTPAHHPITGQPGFLINYPPDIHFSHHESEIPADQLMRLLRRQVAWAEAEGRELERETEQLERLKRREWEKKEAVLEGLMEQTLRSGEDMGLIKGKMLEEMERDLRSDKVRWNTEPEFKRRHSANDGSFDLASAKLEDKMTDAQQADQERRDREDKAEGERADMMAVGALMGLSGAA